MTRDTAIQLAVQGMLLALKIAGPFLVAGLAVGLFVSLFQAATQIQEMTLSFIPKLVAMAVVMVVAGPWMLDQLVLYAQTLFRSIPSLAGP